MFKTQTVRVAEGEINATTFSTCNDGLDNDGDGLIDAEDDAGDGNAGESEDCSDGIDNDEDGWTDQEDPDCQDGGVFEENQPQLSLVTMVSIMMLTDG